MSKIWPLHIHQPTRVIPVYVCVRGVGYAAIRTAASKSAQYSRANSIPHEPLRKPPITIIVRAVPTYNFTGLNNSGTNAGILRFDALLLLSPLA